MKKLLIVVDMQNDFVDGSLGSPEAQAIVPKVCEKIDSWEGDIFYTQDTHGSNYLQTREGKYLPVEHCIQGTSGYDLNSQVFSSLEKRKETPYGVNKNTFGSVDLPFAVSEPQSGSCAYDYIELIGLCTDICVVSNALLLKAYYPETDIAVDATCCAGVTPDTHKAALMTMKMCQIDIKGE